MKAAEAREERDKALEGRLEKLWGRVITAARKGKSWVPTADFDFSEDEQDYIIRMEYGIEYDWSGRERPRRPRIVKVLW